MQISFSRSSKRIAPIIQRASLTTINLYDFVLWGLRRGEAIGLKWDSVDFKNNKVKINHIVTQTLTLVAKDKTKTASSKREYHLLPEVKEMLKIIFAEQKKNKKLFGKSYQNSDYIFTWEDGRAYQPAYITKEFQKVLAKNNFPKCVFMICSTAVHVFCMTKAGI